MGKNDLGSNAMCDWTDARLINHKHPILEHLRGKPLRSRTVMVIWRSLWRSQGPGLGDLTYAQFLVELKKPNGGRVREVRNIGVSMIDELRRVLMQACPEHSERACPDRGGDSRE